MGERLQTCLREGDTLARQGGDDFSILLDDVKEPDDAEIVARRIHDVTAQPFEGARDRHLHVYRKVAPTPNREATSIRPPWSATMPWAMASPSPVP